MQNPFSLGYRPDPFDPRDLKLKHLRGASPHHVMESPDHRRFRATRIEQGRAGSCVSFSKTRAINVAQRILVGGAPEYISPRFDYVVGRRQEDAGKQPETLPPLSDSGQQPRASMEGTRRMGIVKWSDCPYPTREEPATYVDWKTGLHRTVELYDDEEMDRFVNTPLPLNAIHRAYDQVGLSYYRLTRGDGLSAEIREAMLRGYGILIGFHVDQAFMDLSGSGAVDEIDLDHALGGHMTSPLVVEDNGDIISDNWWGPDWGFDDGMFRMTKRCLESLAIIDAFAVRSAPAWETT